jgi:dihydrodipicolinate synthase/N-acetylneuraminate lyase
VLVAAIPTPCLSSSNVDPDALAYWSRTLFQRGVDGLFVLGSTGEMVLIDEDDRRRLVVAAAEQGGPGKEVQVGVGGHGVRQTLRYARLAAQDGAARAIVMAPFFQRLSQEELREFVVEIADESPVPIGLYHHLRMQTTFDVDTVAELARHPNVTLFKDTSTDLVRMRQLIEATRGTGMTLLQGCEDLVSNSLDAGAHGCISALSSIAPEWHRSLLDALKAGDSQTSRFWQGMVNRLLELFRLPEAGLSLAGFVHTLKRAATLRGWLGETHAVLPGFRSSVALDQAIDDIIRRSGLLAESTVHSPAVVRSA